MSTIGNWRGPNIIKEGLVLYLDPGSPNSYYNKTGTTIKDISGNGNNCTLNNQPTYLNTNGGNISFDGTNDYGVIPNSNSLVFNNSDFTLSVWVKIPIFSIGELSGWGFIFTKGMTTMAPANTWGFGQSSTNTNRLSFQFGSNTNGIFDIVMNSGILADGWHNVTVVKKSNVGSMYIDNVFSISGVTTSTLSSTSDIWVSGMGPKYTSTSLSVIKLYNKSLSLEEMTQNYNVLKSRFGL